MPLSKLSDESVLWEGKPGRPILWPALTIIFFILSVGAVLANAILLEFFFPILFTISLAGTIIIALSLGTSRYYVTSQRIVMESGRHGHRELSLEDLGRVEVKSGGINHRRGLGLVIFYNTMGGLALVFMPVKNFEAARRSALDAKSRLPSSPTRSRLEPN